MWGTGKRGDTGALESGLGSVGFIHAMFAKTKRIRANRDASQDRNNHTCSTPSILVATLAFRVLTDIPQCDRQKDKKYRERGIYIASHQRNLEQIVRQ